MGTVIHWVIFTCQLSYEILNRNSGLRLIGSEEKTVMEYESRQHIYSYQGLDEAHIQTSKSRYQDLVVKSNRCPRDCNVSQQRTAFQFWHRGTWTKFLQIQRSVPSSKCEPRLTCLKVENLLKVTSKVLPLCYN